MKSIALSGNNRAERGTSNANILRKEGKIPCVIYGGKENKHFTINEVKFDKLINTPEVYFVDLDIDGTKVKTIIKAVQFHPVTDKVVHVDFMEVQDDKKLTIKIPVLLKGNSKGVLNGGVLRTAKKKLEINGLPNAIPENIEIDITELKIGQSVKVGELDYPGLSFLGADNAVVVAVKTSRVAVEDEEEAEGEEGAEGTEEGAEGASEAKPEAAAAE